MKLAKMVQQVNDMGRTQTLSVSGAWVLKQCFSMDTNGQLNIKVNCWDYQMLARSIWTLVSREARKATQGVKWMLDCHHLREHFMDRFTLCTGHGRLCPMNFEGFPQFSQCSMNRERYNLQSWHSLIFNNIFPSPSIIRSWKTFGEMK